VPVSTDGGGGRVRRQLVLGGRSGGDQPLFEAALPLERGTCKRVAQLSPSSGGRSEVGGYGQQQRVVAVP
jgi:hypothetical protein